MSFRSIILGAVTICLSITVALILGELLLRVIGVKSALVYLPNPSYGWGHTPNSDYEWKTGNIKQQISINSSGLRDREYSYDKPVNTYRILVLGDSFAEALQVSLDESFSKQIERRLNSKAPSPDVDYEVINAGVSGFGTDNALLFFEHEGYKYQSDLVLLALYIGNDIRNNWHKLNNIDSGGIRKPYFEPGERGIELKEFPFTQHSSLRTKVKIFLNQNMVLYSFSRQVLDRFRNRGSKGNDGDSVPLDFGLYEPEYSKDWIIAWEITREILGQLKALVDAQDASLLVMLIPAQPQVDEQGWRNGLADQPQLSNRKWDFEKPNTLAMNLLESLEIDYVDLLPILRATYKTEETELYLPQDGHWNVAGHRVAGEHVTEYLSDLAAIQP